MAKPRVERPELVIEHSPFAKAGYVMAPGCVQCGWSGRITAEYRAAQVHVCDDGAEVYWV